MLTWRQDSIRTISYPVRDFPSPFLWKWISASYVRAQVDIEAPSSADIAPVVECAMQDVLELQEGSGFWSGSCSGVSVSPVTIYPLPAFAVDLSTTNNIVSAGVLYTVSRGVDTGLTGIHFWDNTYHVMSANEGVALKLRLRGLDYLARVENSDAVAINDDRGEVTAIHATFTAVLANFSGFGERPVYGVDQEVHIYMRVSDTGSEWRSSPGVLLGTITASQDPTEYHFDIPTSYFNSAFEGSPNVIGDINDLDLELVYVTSSQLDSSAMLSKISEYSFDPSIPPEFGNGSPVNGYLAVEGQALVSLELTMEVRPRLYAVDVPPPPPPSLSRLKVKFPS